MSDAPKETTDAKDIPKTAKVSEPLSPKGRSAVQGTDSPRTVDNKEPLAAKEASTLRPGPFAYESIPARGSDRDFTNDERKEIDRIEIGRASCRERV